MSQSTETKAAAARPSELLDEVHESARVGQHAAAAALREFRQTVDEAIPEAVQPLRTKLLDAALELADKLVTAQYQFNRNMIHSAERALNTSDDKGGKKE